MIRLVRSGDLGLDVVLGGGWRLVEKLPAKESATIIIRGGPGAGKTLFSVDIALCLAKALNGDVVVGCVELLPSEYFAQIESARPELVTRPLGAAPTWQPTVFLIGDKKIPAANDQARIFCGLLDELDSEAPDLTAAIEAFASRAKSAGARPSVFVIDSLIANYGIGQNTPRRHVDGLMKLAANLGVGLVLCQETTDELPSPWDFSADSVISLGQAENGERQLTVRKHRFGRSAQGAHRFSINGRSQPRVIPRMDAWLKPGFIEMLHAMGWTFFNGARTSKLSWPRALGWTEKLTATEAQSALTVVAAPQPIARQFADAILNLELNDDDKNTRDWVIVLDPLALNADGWWGRNVRTHFIPSVNGPAGFILAFVRLIDHAFFENKPRRIIIGDLALAPIGSEGSWADAIRILAALIGSTGLGVPLIVFESSSMNTESALIKIADVQLILHEQNSLVRGSMNRSNGTIDYFSFASHELKSLNRRHSPGSDHRFR